MTPILVGGQRNDKHLLQDGSTFEIWVNIRQMDWHRKKLQEGLRVRAAQNAKEDLPCSIQGMKRVGSGFSWWFLFSGTACVLAFSLRRFFLRWVLLKCSLSAAPKSRSWGEERRRKFPQDSRWRPSSPSNLEVSFDTSKNLAFHFGFDCVRQFHGGTWVCRNAHEIPTCGLGGCSATTDRTIWFQSMSGPRTPRWLPSRLRVSMWVLEFPFCSADLTNSALDLAMQHLICSKCSVRHVASGGWTSCVQRPASYHATKRVQRHWDGPVFVSVVNVWRASPARTQSVLHTVSCSFFDDVPQTRVPRNRHSDITPRPCDKHSFMVPVPGILETLAEVVVAGHTAQSAQEEVET